MKNNMARLIELTQYEANTKRLVNVEHITDIAVSVFNGKTIVGLSTNIDGENYIEVNETLEQVRILVNGY
nr:MAG TPA: Flagellar and Swarming motility protein [Caudoviricetes sp.]